MKPNRNLFAHANAPAVAGLGRFDHTRKELNGMSIVAQQCESINIPTDREAYRAWLSSLDEHSRLLLFGVERDATVFRCPTNGRLYEDEAPDVREGCIWAHCYWCDTAGRVRGIDRDFDRSDPQPHSYAILEEVHELAR